MACQGFYIILCAVSVKFLGVGPLPPGLQSGLDIADYDANIGRKNPRMFSHVIYKKLFIQYITAYEDRQLLYVH